MGPLDRRRWADEGDTYVQRHSPLVPRVCCKWSQQCNLSWWIEKLNLSFPARLPVPSHVYKFSLFYCQCDSTSLLPLYFSSTAAAPQFGNLRPYTPSSYPLSRYSGGRVLTASISYTASSSVGNAKLSFAFSLCPYLNVEGRLTVLSPNALPLLWTLVEASSFAFSASVRDLVSFPFVSFLQLSLHWMRPQSRSQILFTLILKHFFIPNLKHFHWSSAVLMITLTTQSLSSTAHFCPWWAVWQI